MSYLYIFLLKYISPDSKFMEWLESLCSIEDKIGVFFIKLNRCIKYIPVLWNIYDFDYTSALEVYIFQLKRVYDAMENGHAIHSRTQMRQFKQYILSLERLRDDFNEDQILKELDKRFPVPEDKKFLTEDNFFKIPKIHLTEKYKKALTESLKEAEKRDHELWDFINKFNKKRLFRCWD